MDSITPQKVYYWVQREYQRLDELGNHNDIDNIDSVVFGNAAKHFKLNKKKVHEKYDSFIYTNESAIAGFGAAMKTDIEESKLLDGVAVKINVDRIMTEKKEQSSKGYLEFVEENKDKEFIARLDDTVQSMLHLEGHDFWLFDSRDLIKIN